MRFWDFSISAFLIVGTGATTVMRPTSPFPPLDYEPPAQFRPIREHYSVVQEALQLAQQCVIESLLSVISRFAVLDPSADLTKCAGQLETTRDRLDEVEHGDLHEEHLFLNKLESVGPFVRPLFSVLNEERARFVSMIPYWLSGGLIGVGLQAKAEASVRSAVARIRSLDGTGFLSAEMDRWHAEPWNVVPGRLFQARSDYVIKSLRSCAGAKPFRVGASVSNSLKRESGSLFVFSPRAEFDQGFGVVALMLRPESLVVIAVAIRASGDFTAKDEFLSRQLTKMFNSPVLAFEPPIFQHTGLFSSIQARQRSRLPYYMQNPQFESDGLPIVWPEPGPCPNP